MMKLSSEHVYLNQSATDKADALRRLTDILVQDGLTTADYLTGLQQREQQSATYLGQGIAIPHGTPESRQAILQTGVRLVHFPNGVVWDGQHTIYLAVVISAKSDEHLQILQQLTRALSENVEDKIRQVETAEQLLEILNPTTQHQLYLHEKLLLNDVIAVDIDDVFYQATQILKQYQLVGTGFLSSLNPNQVVSLQDGVWCITGHQAVQQSAICILTLKNAIEFQSLSLKTLVCIASNQTIDLTKLSYVMDILLQHHLDTSSSQTLAEQLGAERIPNWTKQAVILANAHGLHARPATALSQICQQFKGEIKVCVEQGEYVSAKSLTKLLSLGAVRGQTLTFIAEPNSEAEQQLETVIQAVKDGLGEEVEAITEQTTKPSSSILTLQTPQPTFVDDTSYFAVPASVGLAVAQVHIVKEQQFHYEQFAQSITQEIQQLHFAIESVKEQLNQVIHQAKTASIAQIFSAHLAMLDDVELTQPVEQLIKQGLSAPFAWHQHIEQLANVQENLNNTLLAERAADLRDIGRRVLAVLCGETSLIEPSEPYILIKHDLMPSDVAQLDKERVAGILTAVGGASSHSAIVARALGIPAIVGAGENILHLPSQTLVLLDGESGEFIINPNIERVNQAVQEQQLAQQRQQDAEQHCQQPAMTTDHHHIEIAVNLGNVHDAEKAVQKGAEAVGLLRTELVFMSHSSAPCEDAQEKDYRVVLDALEGRPLVVRTLDVGGDKPLPYLPIPAEENPFLGVRGIRLTLRQPELLRQQLRALLKSADGRPLRIMFPMVGRVEEWREANAILTQLINDEFAGQRKDLQVGIMIEVPSAVMMAPILAKEVDFFSIGTNDLTQYVMAIDRGHPELSKEADGLHPSVLQLIAQTVKSAHTHGKWVGICGELAGERQAVPILLGLGVDELSMSASRIPLVKAQIRTLNYKECKELAKQALQCESATAVRALTRQVNT